MAVLPTGIGPVTGGYQIQRSLRFNSADSAYLNRTPASAGNRTTWTWSGWVKSTATSGARTLFDASVTDENNDFWFQIQSNNTIGIQQTVGGTASGQISASTTAVFRDPSAWYHIVLAMNTGSGTSTERAKVYVNNVLQTWSSYTVNSVNTWINSTGLHLIGKQATPNSGYLNGYLTEINFIDGQALTPSDFGETDSATGVWKPKKYTGTYGTNGFYLNFSDNSNTTAATLGKDSSGNGNNWTPNNFSVTAGAGNDSLVDTPTSYGSDTGAGGEVRGNYCTLNPLDVSANTLSNGNLDITYATNSDTNRGGTIAVSTGKWYFEATVQAVGGTYAIIGVTSGVATATSLGSAAYQYSYISSTGNKFNNGSSTAYGNTYTTGDVIGVALDMDNGKVWFSKNGTFQASGDPAAGTNQAFSGLSGSFSPAINARNNSIVNLNCGQRPFAYTAPSGFKALCTQNLPTPTIGATSTTQAGKYFNTVLYTGNGSTLAVTGVGFQPDFVWLKSRGAARSHRWWDVLRGVTKGLSSDLTNAEYTESGLTAFDSDGFTLGSQSGSNTNAESFVAWNWKANGAGSSNTQGTITSTVSANTTAGFSIVTYTGTGANATVGHGLGVAPRMIIYKARTGGTSNWVVGHQGFNGGVNPWQYVAYLDLTNAVAAAGSAWNNTAPTSSVFSIGGAFNPSGWTMVAYCFAEVAGYSAFGSYTGNGSADGPFVFTGFRPRYFLIKASGLNESWYVYDSARNIYNVVDLELNPNNVGAEATFTTLDFVSNGFKIRTTNSAFNTNGETYIYAAFAEVPQKFSLAR